jgi:hypothetical protein
MYCFCTVYLFGCNCLFLIVVVRRQWLQESSRARHSRLWAIASGRVRQVTLDHNWSNVLSLSRSHIGLHALILLPKTRTLGMWVHTWLVMLIYAVMSVVQVFHPLWCWVWLVPLWECNGLPSFEMWFDRVRIDVVVWAMVRMVDMVKTVMACGARIC